MAKILLILTVCSISSCTLFKPQIEIVEKIVTQKQIITEKGETITLYDTITKTEVKDRWLEREESKREKSSDKFDYKTLIAQNRLLKDSLNISRRKSRNDNNTLKKLEKQKTKQDRIYKNQVTSLERQISKQKKQQEKTDRAIYWVVGIFGLCLLALLVFLTRKRR